MRVLVLLLLLLSAGMSAESAEDSAQVDKSNQIAEFGVALNREAEADLLMMLRQLDDGPEREQTAQELARAVHARTGSLRETELQLLTWNALDGLRVALARAQEDLRRSISQRVQNATTVALPAKQTVGVELVELADTPVQVVGADLVLPTQSSGSGVRGAAVSSVPPVHLVDPMVAVGCPVPGIPHILMPSSLQAVPVEQAPQVRAAYISTEPPQLTSIDVVGSNLAANLLRTESVMVARIPSATLECPVPLRHADSRDVLTLSHQKGVTYFQAPRFVTAFSPVATLPPCLQFRQEIPQKSRRRENTDPRVQTPHSEVRVLLALMESELDPGRVSPEGAGEALQVCSRILATPLDRDLRDTVIFKAWAYHKKEDAGHTFGTFSEWLRQHYKPGSDAENDLLLARIANEAGDHQACLDRLQPYLNGTKSGLPVDQCLFMTGAAQLKLMRPDLGEKTLQLLLQEHPASPLRPKALLLMGWMALMEGDEADAKTYLQQLVEEHPTDSVSEKGRQLLEGIAGRQTRQKETRKKSTQAEPAGAF